MSHSSSGGDDRPVRRSRKDEIKLVTGGGAIVLGVLFALLNTQRVTIHWIFTTTQTPLIAALAVTFVLGALAGYGFSHVRRRRARRR
jgi:uncharacterized integral membrane protein